jgi:sensor c-di-GMP phosphodiesterase-like protein
VNRNFFHISRKPIARLAMILAGGLFGAILAYSIAHLVQLRLGRNELMNYANRLLGSSQGIRKEVDATTSAVANDGLPPCSDKDIEFMRYTVFTAIHVKDLGRIEEGKLTCTTSTGRIAKPPVMSAPDVSYNGIDVRVAIPTMISSGAHGFEASEKGISAILNPDGYSSLDEPPKFYSGYVHDRPHRRVIYASFGHVVPLTGDEVLAGKLITRNGVLYRPLCDPLRLACVVAAESRSDVLAGSRSLLRVSVIAGALFGGASCLILTLFDLRRRSLEQQLRRALQKDALTVVYQPVVDLTTHAIVGAEALVRWTNEDGEFIRPDIFVPLAEARGFVGEITCLVLRHVVRELGSFLRTDGFYVTINITSQDLTNPEFINTLGRNLHLSKVKPAAIGLELTERSTANIVATQALAQLKAAGHLVYIDDFGTGYSSLSYLHRLKVNAIKIDRSFTQTVGTQAVTASVVPQILSMATQLNLQVVVEGIETKEQADYFRGAGPGILGQGWLFGRPVPANQFCELLHNPVIEAL